MDKPILEVMKLSGFTFIAALLAFVGCAPLPEGNDWRGSVNHQVNQLGYQNWIIITEASFPARNRPGFRQINADEEVAEVVDYVLNALEETQHVRPRIYLTRELRSVDNNFAPGIEDMRKRITTALHGYEPTELDQQSLLTLTDSANKNFEVLVIRTPTALPYTSVFMELQPGYWDAESEDRLRGTIEQEKREKLSQPVP